MTRKKVDANQRAIVQDLRAAGAFVQSLASVGNGCLDLLVGYRGEWCVMEIKDEDGKLTPKETDWIERAVGIANVPVWIVRSPEAALDAIGA